MIPSLFVVDDDYRLRSLIKEYLEKQGYLVSTASSGEDAISVLSYITFDLIILDIMMPNKSGFDVMADIKNAGVTTPVLFLSAMGTIENRIEGLERGADEYIAKPFEPRELLLRIQAIFRRTHTDGQLKNSIGPYSIDYERRLLLANGQEIILTETEMQVLIVLKEFEGSVVSREHLMNKIWQKSLRAIDVVITRLRKKIEKDPRKPRILHTVRNSGYRLCE